MEHREPAGRPSHHAGAPRTADAVWTREGGRLFEPEGCTEEAGLGMGFEDCITFEKVERMWVRI